uniref:Col_cuticle_N domain-containing protein n=1 Tax=Parastrongyloides trichosuri TaxID=131310 RepID=A0A0N4ZJ82_PARTI
MASIDQMVSTVDNSIAALTSDASTLIKVLTICLPLILVAVVIIFIILLAVLLMTFHLRCMKHKTRVIKCDPELGTNGILLK